MICLGDELLGSMLSKTGSKTQESTREIPHNNEAEQALLGAILLDPPVIDEAVEIVSPRDFFSGNLGRIFGIMEKMRARGENIDAVTLRIALPWQSED